MAKDKDKSAPQRGGSAKLTRTEQRQKERRSEQRRQRLIFTTIAIAVVLLVAIAVLVTTNTPAEAPIPDTVSRYEGIVQSVSSRGYPQVGSLDGIAVTLYTSFGCDACNTFHNSVLPQLLDRVRDGEILLTYVPLRAGAVSNYEVATRSALCAARQQKFFEYADALVHWQELYGNSAFAGNRLTTGAEVLGLDRSQFDSCRSTAPEGTVFQQAASDIGGRNTALVPPSVYVNGVEVLSAEDTPSTDIVDINAAIDDAIDFRSGAASDEATPEPTNGTTDDATAEPTAEPTETVAAQATDAPTEAVTEAPDETPAP